MHATDYTGYALFDQSRIHILESTIGMYVLRKVEDGMHFALNFGVCPLLKPGYRPQT